MKIERPSAYIVKATSSNGRSFTIWQPPGQKWSNAEISKAVRERCLSDIARDDVSGEGL